MSLVDDKIAELQERISKNEIEIGFCDEDINRAKSILKKTVPESEIENYISAKTVCANELISELNKVGEQDTVTTLETNYDGLNELGRIIEDKVSYESTNELLKEELESLKTEKSAPSEESKPEPEPSTPSQEGHLYPVKIVSNWTNKLKQYNKQMDDFIAKIDALDVNVDLTWLCKKVESFCRKINYAIAMVRYEIVKGLSAIYKQANVFSTYIDPIANFNPTDIFACLGWVKSVIKFFLGPYMTVIQFVSDFMTYTPPLVSEAAKLVGKTASVPVHLLGTINFVAEGKDGEQKELAQAMSEYCSIKAEPITLGDIMGGGGEKPTMATSNFDSKQKELYEKQKDTALTKIQQTWTELEQYLNSIKGYRETWVARPAWVTQLSGNTPWYSKSQNTVSNYPVDDPNCIYISYVKIECFGKKGSLSSDSNTKKINTRRHKFAQMTNVEMFRNEMAYGGDLFKKVTNYYGYLYGKSTKDTADMLAYCASWVGYIKTYSVVFPRIPEFLDKVGEGVKEYNDIVKKADEI